MTVARRLAGLGAAAIVALRACGSDDDDTSADDGDGTDDSNEPMSTDPVQAELEVTPDVSQHGMNIVGR